MVKRLKEKLVGFLRWSERYTRTDMVYLAHGGFWITVGRMVGAGSGFLLTLLLANTISKEALGTYKFVQSLAGIVTAFSLSGMGTAVTQAVAQGRDSALLSGFKTFMRWSVLMTVIAWGAAVYYFLQGNVILGWSLLIVGVALPLSQGGGFYDAFLLGKKDFRKETIFGLWVTVIPMLATGITALFTEVTPFLVLSFFGGSAIVAMVLFSRIKKQYHLVGSDHLETLSYGKHLSVINILGMISTQMDRLLVFHFLGALQMALYSVALAVPQQLRFGSKLLAQMSLPKFSGTDPGAIYKTLPRKALLVFFVSVGIVLFYVLVAPLFFKVFFPQYMDAVRYSQIFSLVILFFPATLFQQFFVGQMKQKILYALQTAVPLIKIILLFILVPLYGILGALYAIFGMELFRLVAVLIIFNVLARRHATKLIQ
jgi:O-antigen/teichoic acid export membrane protein